MKRVIALALCLLLFSCAASAQSRELDAFAKQKIADLTDLLRGWFDVEDDSKMQTMTVEKAVLALRDAGLNVEQELAYELMAGYDETCTPLDVMLVLGLGEYNEDAIDFVPVSNAVYAFDAEIFHIDCMYTNFLRGIQMIVPGIEISDVKEDLSQMTYEMDFSNPIPTDGKRTFSFLCNGHPYSIELESNGDWFNDDAIVFINDVLKKEAYSGRLCVLDVMDIQGYLIFYGNEDTIANVLNLLGVQEGELIL